MSFDGMSHLIFFAKCELNSVYIICTNNVGLFAIKSFHIFRSVTYGYDRL